MPDTWNSISDWYDRGPFAEYVVARRAGGSRNGVTLVRFKQPPGDFSDPPIADFQIGLSQASVRGGWDFGLGTRHGRAKPGAVYLVAPNTSTKIVLNDPSAGTIMSFAPGHLRVLKEAQDDTALTDLGRLHEGLFSDPALHQLLNEVWSVSADQTTQSQLFVDHALMMVAWRLDVLSKRKLPARAVRPLADDLMARALAFIDDRIDISFGLVELAQHCNMSPFHFSRAFKQATGQTPHQFVLSRRVERARQMIIGTRLPLADIAYATGFSSQAHMTKTFTNMLGETPGKIRSCE